MSPRSSRRGLLKISSAVVASSVVGGVLSGCATGASRSWGSGSPGQVGNGIDFSIEQRFEAGSELAVEDSAADLEQEVGATTGPSHLLGFVHAAVDQEVGSAFGERGTDPQPGAMALGIVDQPSALAGQIAVDFAQRGPQPA